LKAANGATSAVPDVPPTIREHRIAETGAAMQCKDIPDRPILEFLLGLNGRWGTWFTYEPMPDNTVVLAMPKGTPEKLVCAKMRQLIKRGLVDGCDCGCRGDYVLTDKGRAALTVSAGEATK
jgi:hypothetical protein